MKKADISEFLERLNGIKGTRRRSIIGGLHYRINTGSSRESIAEYLDSCLGVQKELYLHPLSHTVIHESTENFAKATDSIEVSKGTPVSITQSSPRRFLGDTLLFLQVLRSFSFLSFVGELKNRYLYLLCRLSIYVAVIGTSYHPIEAFFSNLDIFNGLFLKGLSGAIAIAVDLVAMDLFARSVEKVVHKRYLRALTLAAPALIVVFGNILITKKFMSSSARTLELEERNHERAAEIRKREADVSAKEDTFSQKKASFLALKWRGEMYPEKCESREIECRGPYTTLAQPAQIEYLSSESSLNLAKNGLERARQEKTEDGDILTLTDDLKTRSLVYSLFWLVILLTYVYQPRKS